MKRRPWLVALLLVGAVVALLAGRVVWLRYSYTPPAVTIYKIAFDPGVSGADRQPCAIFAVTYATATGSSQREVEVCQEPKIVARERGDFAPYLSVQNIAPQNSGARFSCIIENAVTVLARNESVGVHNIATCAP